MASPQAENGHVDIANEIADALARIRISGEENQCLWVIFRKTYGWHKKRDRISLSQFVLATGLKKPNVCRALNKLQEKNIIKKDNADITSYYFQKDYTQWNPLSKKIMTVKQQKSLSKKIMAVIKNDNASLSKMIHTKETTTKETITKEKKNTRAREYSKSKDYPFVKLSEVEYVTLISKIGETETLKYLENLNNYIGSKGKKYKSHYHTILTWRNNDEQRNRGYIKKNSGSNQIGEQRTSGKSKYDGIETVL